MRGLQLASTIAFDASISRKKRKSFPSGQNDVDGKISSERIMKIRHHSVSRRGKSTSK